MCHTERSQEFNLILPNQSGYKAQCHKVKRKRLGCNIFDGTYPVVVDLLLAVVLASVRVEPGPARDEAAGLLRFEFPALFAPGDGPAVVDDGHLLDVQVNLFHCL